MESLGYTGENRTTFGASFVANCDDASKVLARLNHVEHRFGLVAGDVNADFLHYFHDGRIEIAWLESGTVRLEFLGADLV